jgi:hypothetical protein
MEDAMKPLRLALVFVGFATVARGQAATNLTVPTSCAEHDNVNVPILGRARSFVIEATHPAWNSPSDCTADFTSCPTGPGRPEFPSPPATTPLYDDGTTVVEAVTEPAWWRPGAMTARVGANVASDVHYLRIARKVADAPEWPQVLVLYVDGNLRLIPHPPPGLSLICFGSSVVVGPAAFAPRPFAELSSVEYLPASDSLRLVYRAGWRASIQILTVNRAINRVRYAFDAGLLVPPMHALVTFRSMFVEAGNADVDRVAWTDLAGAARDEPIMTFPLRAPDLSMVPGRQWLFYRGTPSVHNTTAPDIRIILELPAP